MFWKKKLPVTESKLILGMLFLSGNHSFDIEIFKADFQQNNSEAMQDVTGDSNSAIITIDGESVAVAFMPVPIPFTDIEETAKYAYNWQTVLEDTAHHKSHLLVSVLQSEKTQVSRYKIFTKVICSLLRATNAIGLYQGMQSLLIPKDDYLAEAALLDEDILPINLWIYFGLRLTDEGASCYTYGLAEFNKYEMEIVNSRKQIEEVRNFASSITSYVLDYDVAFKDGQTCGFSEDEKIGITLSKGKFLEGKTFKLAY
jgi:hypothetical protein